MREIKLTQGKVALVDDCDFEELNKFKWHAYQCGKNFYAGRGIWVDGKTYSIKMHRQILGLTTSKIHCDHINGNGLDNRRCNLRKCTHAENQRNVGINRLNKTGFKGVSWHSRDKRFEAKIRIEGVKKHIGYFVSVSDAARAYDEAAKKYHGEFAKLNFPKNEKLYI